jgi:cytochrome c biogenesis protein CcdA/thiol-disulfide isomerase/thioredoxin
MPEKKTFVPTIAVFTLFAVAMPLHAGADGGIGSQDDLRLEVSPNRRSYAGGDTVVVGVKASIPPGYHLYSNPLGPGIGKPLNLFVNRRDAGAGAPRDVLWDEVRKSPPARYNPPVGDWVWAYEGEAYFFLKGVMERGAAAVDAPSGTLRAVACEIVVEALMCKNACVPILKSAAFELPAPGVGDAAPGVGTADNPGIVFRYDPVMQSRYVKSEPMAFSAGPSGPPPVAAVPANQGGINIDLSGLSGLSGGNRLNDTVLGTASLTGDGGYGYAPVEERREYGIVTALLFAFLAGLALNLTPCIFPMLSVRVLSFAQGAGESRRLALARSAVFSLGIVAVFLLLAGLAAFAGFSWGQQFQNPVMLVGIIAVVFLFALGMFGFYTLPVPRGLGGGGKGSRSALAGDFLKGMAATVMATPCGGPFLGALLAWALLQKPLAVFAIFAVMGVGMAFPYVLLASSKRLVSLLPKPGRWIEDLKYLMGFLLLAFAVNMMRGLDPRLTVTAVGVCLSILFAASVNRRFTQFGMPAARRAVVALASLALLAAGLAVSATCLRIDAQIIGDDGRPGVGGPYWVSFSKQALAAAHDEGRNVLVNFTASWCTNCKLNKAAVLNTSAARRLYGEKKLLLLTADITNDNPEAQELLKHLGSRSVPFLALFPGDNPERPVIMRDILSKEKFLGELRKLP